MQLNNTETRATQILKSHETIGRPPCKANNNDSGVMEVGSLELSSQRFTQNF